jgi:hypothetical protein
MAGALYNKGKTVLVNGTTIWGTADLRALLVTSSYTFNADHNFVSDITNELSGGNYARVALTGETVTEDDTNDRAVCDASDTTFSALAAAAGTPARAIIFDQAGGADSARALICCVDLTSPATPNGGDYTIQWASTGIAYMS